MKAAAIIFGLLLTVLGLYGYLSPVQGGDDSVVAEKTDSESSDTDAEEKGSDDKAEKKTGSKTALIPAVFGLPLMLCGTLAFIEDLRKHAMHVAAGIALVGGLMAGGRGLMKINALFGDDPVSQRAVTMVLTMAVICLIYVGLSVRSFIAARKAGLIESA